MDENKIEELKDDEGLEISGDMLDVIAGGAFNAVFDSDEEDVVTKKPIPKMTKPK